MFQRIVKKEIVRNKILDSLIFLLLVEIFCMVIMTFSSLEEGINKFHVLSDQGGAEGNFYITNMLMNPETGYLIHSGDMLKEAIGDSFYTAGEYQLLDARIEQQGRGEYQLPGMETEYKNVSVWSYDWDIAASYLPHMVDGRWFKKKDLEDTDTLYGVMVDTGQYQVGDMITIYNTYENVPLEIKIIGLVEDSSSVFGYNAYRELKDDYRDCYYTYNFEYEQVPLLLLLNDQIKPVLESAEGGYVWQQKGALFITWDDGISEKELEKLDTLMQYERNEIRSIIPLSEMKKSSKKQIRKGLLNTVPVFFCIFVLVTLATISVSAISVKTGLHHYAIYYLCGLCWKDCCKISFLHSASVSLAAFFVSFGCMMLLSRFRMLENVYVKLSILEIVGCMLVWLLFTGISLIFPIYIIRRNSAKEILSKEK